MTERLRNLSKVMKPDPGVKIRTQVPCNPQSTLCRHLSRSVSIRTEQRLETDPKSEIC